MLSIEELASFSLSTTVKEARKILLSAHYYTRVVRASQSIISNSDFFLSTENDINEQRTELSHYTYHITYMSIVCVMKKTT